MTAPAAAPDGRPEMVSEAQRSSRDHEVMRAQLQLALARHLPGATDHQVGQLEGTSATGMSSETLLFEASWREGGELRSANLVARVAPDPHDVPVFPSYDIPGQFKTIETVDRLTDVPVPPPWWCEADPSYIGAQFFVMGRVEGQVPPDVMPYNFGDSWLFNASPEDQARLQDSSIRVLVSLHAIPDPLVAFAHLDPGWAGDTALRRHFTGRRNWYEWAAKDCGPSSLVEKGFRWLEDHWPVHESPATFNWGDSRIGNVLYRDFEPAAVLDWEMAAIGPPELDVAWMIHLHQAFEAMAHQYGFPGMPDFMRAEEVAATYEARSGRRLHDLDWYITYSCLQMSIVYLRTSQRSVHFGEREAPADADELLMNGPTLAAIVS